MKSARLFSSLLVCCLLFLSCTSSAQSKKGSLKEAQSHFIDAVQYMSERDALSHEISYYKDPQITVARKVSDLTGKDAIHECNLMLKENQQVERDMDAGRMQYGRIWYVDDVKQYALDHPDKIVGAKYYFEGLFTHYDNGYGKKKGYVLCMNGRWFVQEDFKL